MSSEAAIRLPKVHFFMANLPDREAAPAPAAGRAQANPERREDGLRTDETDPKWIGHRFSKILARGSSKSDDDPVRFGANQMELLALLAGAMDLIMHEVALFAAFGFLLLGASDLLVDFIWIGLTLKRRRSRVGVPAAPEGIAPAGAPGRLAIFTPAWDEAAVIGAMLAYARTAFGNADHVHYIGCYANDPGTAAAVWAHAGPRVRLVVAPGPGPTSKADCLNHIWARMVEDEQAQGTRFKAVVLHDAEDVVHSAELPLFDALIERFDLVQLPVLPLIDHRSRWVSGHYADEFTEAHGKELVVRAGIGASLPSAGVGCAISRDALAALAARYGTPFDPASLTEDYELGLRLKALGRSAAFVRAPAGPHGAIVCTREYFPATLDAAVAQKSRWMAGIALSGWDRLGWRGGLAERWMRARDRQAILAAFVLGAAYLALVLWAVLFALERLGGPAMRPFGPVLTLLIAVNSMLLLWRLAMRFGFVAQAYGWREGLRALPRTVTGNIIALMAARRALGRYLRQRRTGASVWGKTAHAFPDELPAE
jgi:adsorption protein B